MNRMRMAVLSIAALALTHAGAAPMQARGVSQYPNRYQSQPGRFDRLTGTYELDRSRSDDPRRASDQVVRQLPPADRARVSERLANRLDPPDVLALDRQGPEIMVASSRAPQVRFEADGRARTERTPNGRTLTTRATLAGGRLDVSTRGESGVDFAVTFDPIDNGNGLRVTRQIFDERLRQPVTVVSVYRKVSDTPNWDVYAVGRGGPRPMPGRDVEIPPGMTLFATLDQPIDYRTIRRNDRVSLTVHNAPRPDLQGATIEGTVIGLPAVNGRTGMTIDFDEIRLRNGRSGEFEGTIAAIRGPAGESIAYDNEEPRPNDQAGEAVQRGAIGAAIGAVIGAVAGGGKGAAIGAAIGAGGAAATVYADARYADSLPRGTEFTIRSR